MYITFFFTISLHKLGLYPSSCSRSKKLSAISVHKEVRLPLFLTSFCSKTRLCEKIHAFISDCALNRLSSALGTIYVFTNSLMTEVNRPQGLLRKKKKQLKIRDLCPRFISWLSISLFQFQTCYAVQIATGIMAVARNVHSCIISLHG